MLAEVLRDAEKVAALARPDGPWSALWRAVPEAARAVTLHPAWVSSWWRTLGGEGELLVVVCRDGEGGEPVAIAPFYLAPPRGGALRSRELRLVGGTLIAPRRAMLAAPARESEARRSVAFALAEERGWDLLDLALGDSSEVEALAGVFAEAGRSIDVGFARLEVGGDDGGNEPDRAQPGRAEVALDGERHRIDEPPPPAARFTVGDIAATVEQLRAAGGTAAEPAFLRFLELALPDLCAAGAASVIVARDGDAAVGASVLLHDGARWVELVTAAEPRFPSEALTREGLRRAAAAGASRFELADPRSPLATSRASGARLKVYGPTVSGAVQRGYATLVRSAGRLTDAAVRAPIDAAASGLEALHGRLQSSGPSVQRAVAQVATFSRLHLYRGELFVRGGAPPAGVTLRLFSLADFEALTPPQRAGLLSRLGLDERYAREKWQRGDTVVVAELHGEAAGIVWCARRGVLVPDIGREVKPLGGECYIHDVYVPPEARGRALAPSMLDFLARELRRRDIYRAWALIERSNTPSTRAFEKAAYASVADVIYARMGRASKLLVRPPDPEARRFLGLPPRRGA